MGFRLKTGRLKSFGWWDFSGIVHCKVDEVRAELGRSEFMDICSIEALSTLLFRSYNFLPFKFFSEFESFVQVTRFSCIGVLES